MLDIAIEVKKLLRVSEISKGQFAASFEYARLINTLYKNVHTQEKGIRLQSLRELEEWRLRFVRYSYLFDFDTFKEAIKKLETK